MSPESNNPYALPMADDSPEALPGRRRRRRRGWGEFGSRAFAVVVGFSLVADPTSLPGVGSALFQAVGGVVFARGLGLVLLALAFLPWRAGRTGSGETQAGVVEGEFEEL